MSTRSVLFLPDNITVQVEQGSDLLAAAGQAGIEIKASCGGDGTCGKCAIRLTKGKAGTREGHVADASLEEQGLSLACQTVICDEDLVVEIPEETRLNEHQVLLEMKPEENGGSQQPDLLIGYPLQPLCRQIELELAAPNLQDNCDDVSRLILALKKQLGHDNIIIPLPVLRTLAENLRAENFKVTVILTEDGGRAEMIAVRPGGRGRLYGVAVDIGTTTVVAYLLDLATGKLVGVEGSHNAQARFGDDVISRIVHTVEEPDGLAEVHQAVVDTVNQLVAALTTAHGICPDNIYVMMTAGNTTMAHLFMGMSPKYIRLEPYIPTAAFFPVVAAEELGIGIYPQGKIYSFPAVASYVGGDIVSGTLVTRLDEECAGMSLLIDIGTNGEMVLGLGDSMVTCSCSAGPAFEGSGIKCGMRAMQGAIERIEIQPETYEVSCQTIGQVPALGICGSALIDCLAKLRQTGLIDRAGKFQTQVASPRMRTTDVGPEFVVAWQQETGTGKDITISEADVKNLLRAKGAVFAGIRTLLQIMGLPIEEIQTIYVAGGFGNYLNIPDAIRIGLLPDLPVEKYHFIGNSSGQGACLALLSQPAWHQARQLASKMTYIELSQGNLFMEEFISALFIPHTDISLFPSI